MTPLRRTATPLLLGLGVLALPPGASAASAACSRSGDSCYSAERAEGTLRLKFATFSYRGKVKICLRSPRGNRECKTFRLRTPDRFGIREINAKASAHFDFDGKGTYRAYFRPTVNKRSLRPSVTFRLR